MSLNYQAILWNKQKKQYDKWMLILIFTYLILFAVLTIVFRPNTSLETLIIRAFGSLAILMLHIILAIGPLARLNPSFLPLLYNRRHLGVSMFLVAAVHGVFSIMQFHSLGDTGLITSVFTANMDYGSLVHFPFQVLGFLALLILLAMATTSHDFWLANLGPRVWKSLHMMVYVAYAASILHVFLGAFQQETSPLLLALLGIGMVILVYLHIRTGFIESRKDGQTEQLEDTWQYVCEVGDIIENRAKMVNCDGERIAVFKYKGKLSAVSNVCRHQQGPLGEGKIVDGCITCPWHGYQYLPENGQSPPPFTEKVETYQLRLDGQKIYVDPKANPPGTPVEPVRVKK